MPRVKNELSPKQANFIREYLVDLHATNAAIRAGYSQKTAGNIGYQCVIKLEKHIKAAQAKAAQKTELTRERILLEYQRLALLDPAQLHDEDGRLLPIHLMPEDARRAISSLEHVETKGGLEQLRKVRLSDKRAALDSISKLLGFEPAQEHNVTVGYSDALAEIWERRQKPADSASGG